MNSKPCHSIRFSWTIDRFSSLSNVVQKKITQSGESNTEFEIALVYSVSSAETHDIDVELRRLDTQKCPTEIVCKTRMENHWGRLIRKNREVVVLDPYNDSRIVLSSTHPLKSDEGLVMLPYDKLVLQCVLKVTYCCEHPDQLHGLISVTSDDAEEEPGTSFQELYPAGFSGDTRFGIQKDLEVFQQESKVVFRYESEAGIKEESKVLVLVDSGTDVQEEFCASLQEESDACIQSVSGIQDIAEVVLLDEHQDDFQEEHNIRLVEELV